MNMTTGYIGIDGKYHKGDKISIDTGHASTNRQYSHDRQREMHKADLVQPYKNGEPNDEFITLYPEESRNYGFI